MLSKPVPPVISRELKQAIAAETIARGNTKLRIWLVTIGEPLPLGVSKGDRLHRTGQFARFLAAQGHSVLWWTSTFDHFRKVHHFESDTTTAVSPNLSVRALKGCGYSRNISLSRFKDHIQIARSFAAIAEKCESPDIIVAALPTVELCRACTEYGKFHGVPVILDMRDMWPDLFVDAVPRVARPIARLLLSPLYRQAREACNGATAIIGITEEFVEWGLRRGARKRGPLDRTFPLAYEGTVPPAEKLDAADRFWDELGVLKNDSTVNVCYFGNVGVQLDLAHIIEAARVLNRGQRPIKVVLCGRGERLEEYRRQAKDLPNVLLPGWVDGSQIWSLMGRSAAGLDPLPNRYDFLATINNKAVEYLSAGLPVISSPRSGVLCKLLTDESCGVSYSAGSATELVETMERLIGDKPGLAAMSARAKVVFERLFLAESVHKRMAEFLSEVVSHTRASLGAAQSS
jgi:glycosyltransferase involved in cell wall biosynthesis